VVVELQIEDGLSLRFSSIVVFSTVLRPIISNWNPLLEDYKATKPSGTSTIDFERKWEKAVELRGALEGARVKLVEFAGILADVAGVPSLLPQVLGSD
jgi:hypothetical protein